MSQIETDTLLLVGDSGIGKSAVFKEFCRRNENILYLSAPKRPNLHDMFDEFFRYFAVPYRRRELYSERKAKIKHYCDVYNIQMIIIDNLETALPKTKRAKIRKMEFITGIKNLSNIVKRPFVLAGTKDAVEFVIDDEQLKREFVPTLMKNWEHNEEYFDFLNEIERNLPLREPLHFSKDKKLAKEILDKSNGILLR